MQWSWHMTLLMTVGQKWQDPVWWEWTATRERGREGWRWRCQVSPEYLAGCPGAQLHGPGPTTVYQKISWHRLQDQDTRLCIHSNSSEEMLVVQSESLTQIGLSKKQGKVSSKPKSWLETKSLPLWRWLILILVVNSSLMLSLLINHYFKYGSIMWHLFLSIMINQMGMRLEYTSSSCHRFLPVTRAHGVDGA